MDHETREVEAAIQPTAHEVAIAQHEILGLLAKGIASAAALYATVGKRPLKDNGYKVALAREHVRRVLRQLAG